MKILITGCFGFIGSNLTRYMLKKYPEHQIMGLDAMTYAARPSWVQHLTTQEEFRGRFTWVVCDLTNAERTQFMIKAMQPDHVIHLAAESHVCRSIETPRKFLDTNVVGTYNLLEACMELWKGKDPRLHRFHHVSTDEVYGELEYNASEMFHEEHSYAPRSPYAASKAASDHFVKSFHHTYGMNSILTNCSNNYGPNQDTEKLIPKTIMRLLNGDPVVLYGTGKQVRDWLYVEDHCSAIDEVFTSGLAGHTYCVGGDNQMTNTQVVERIHGLIDTHRKKVRLEIEYKDARPTDDKRYAVNSSKLQSMGWNPRPELFDQNILNTIDWYIENASFFEESKLL